MLVPRLTNICYKPGMGWPGVALSLSLLLPGCETRVAGGLDEADANQAITHLAERGMAAAKESDPEAEGRYKLSVSRAEAPAAVAFLAQEGLPRRRSPGVLEALESGAIIPSRAAEHARWLAGTAGDLERSLGAIDGMLSARVHLALPMGDPLAPREAAPAPATASVLLSYRGTPQLSVAQIQQLVAGAVPALAPSSVNVVMHSAPRPAQAELKLAQVGPVTVTQASASALKAILGGLIGLNLLLLAATWWLWQQARKARSPALEKPSVAVPSPG